MADLIAIGYDDTTTAIQAMEEAERLSGDLIIEADAIAAIIRNEDGKLKTVTNQHTVGAGTVSGMFWGMLFGLLFFVPVFGVVMGGIFGAIFGKLGDMGIKDAFRAQVQDLVQPNSSALVLVFTSATADRALAGLAPMGGEVLRTSLSREAEAEIQKALDAARETPPPT